jgi:hypothetical protein
MAELRSEGEPVWPPHLAKYRTEDGWESEYDWEVARVRFARARGFKNFKILPLLQRMASGAVGAEPNKEEGNK